jgi:hypothetical protein
MRRLMVGAASLLTLACTVTQGRAPGMPSDGEGLVVTYYYLNF